MREKREWADEAVRSKTEAHTHLWATATDLEIPADWMFVASILVSIDN